MPLVLLLAVGTVVAGVGAGLTFSAFTSTTSNPPSSFDAKAIFPAARTTTAWSFKDAVTGTETDRTHGSAYGDGVIYTPSAFSNAYSSTRYIDFDFNDPLPAGLAVSALTFDFAHLPTTSGRSACYFVEVRRVSTGAVLATHGSSGSPVACKTGTTFTTTSTAITAVTGTDVANDLRIRVYGWVVGGGEAFRIDRATLTVTALASLVLRAKRFDDRADTTSAVTWWHVAVEDTTYFTSGNWPSSANTARYLKFRFPTTVPLGAVVTGATIRHRFASNTTGNTCYYLELYSGATLLSTHGSSGSPLNCANTTFEEDVVAVPAIDTVGEANNVVARLVVWNSGSSASRHDKLTLTLDWSLNDDPGQSQCTAPGSQTINASADSWIEQGSPSANKGTDSKLIVDSKSPNLNMRALVQFAYPSLPAGCAVTDALLEVNQLTQQGTRTIEAWQLSGSWTENGVTWSNQPATTGSPATTSTGTGWRSWDVSSIVAAQLAGQNNGFLLRDATENSATEFKQEYAAREDSSNPDPRLTLSWN